MRTRILVLLLSTLAPPALAAESKPPPTADASAPAASPIGDFAFEVAPKVGFFKTTTPALGALFVGLEVGASTPLLDRRLSVAFEANWHMPTTEGVLTDPRLTVDGVTADGTYSVIAREFGFMLSAVFRQPELVGHLAAYGGLGPSLTYHRETVFGFGSTTVETESNLGFQVLAGADYPIGPGNAFLEVHYHFTTVDFLGTGKVTLGGFLAAGVGYRLTF